MYKWERMAVFKLFLMHLVILASASDLSRVLESDGQPLDPSDFLAASNVVSDGPSDSDPDPITLAGLFEGDIVDVDIDQLNVIDDESVPRNAIKDAWRRWPGGIVPYTISGVYNSNERSVIAKAMKLYHQHTCIRFVPRVSERAYIFITKGNGCSSAVGRTGSMQQVSLANGCVYTGIVIHELMHAIGFWHEQSRADRDGYIRIEWQNIMRGMEYNFDKYSLNKISHLGTEYDTCSVMHYGAFAFSKNRQPTITKRVSNLKCKLGQREGFSSNDITKINILYECKDGKKEYTTTTGKPITMSTTTLPPTTTAITEGTKCQNSHEHCEYWASEGECLSNPDYMLLKCALACHACDNANKCRDHNQHCQYWADDQQCDENPEYMHVYCKNSCHIC